jgi:hypothetical protein
MRRSRAERRDSEQRLGLAGHVNASTRRLGDGSEDVSEQRLTVRVLPERLVKEVNWQGNGCRGESTCPTQRPLKSLLTLGTRLYFDLCS